MSFLRKATEMSISRAHNALLVAFLCFTSLSSQQACGSPGSTTTINSNAAATSLANCSSFAGSIAIGETASGDVYLNGPSEIVGNLVVENVLALTSLNSDTLERLDGNFSLQNMTLLSTLSFPLLTTVVSINFHALPNIAGFTFTAGLSSVSNVTISNTFLSSLAGINLLNADLVQISNNPHLLNADLPLETSKQGIEFTSNGISLNVTLPQLTTAGSITLNNVSFAFFPSLSFLSGSLSVQGNSITALTADSLSVVTQDVILTENADLKEVSFQGLLSAGSIDIEENPLLTTLNFGKLARAGDVNIGGNITVIEMPVLTSVNNTFILNSTDPEFNCSIFDTDHANSIIKGTYSCQGTHQVSTPGPGPSPQPGLSAAAKGGIAAGCVVLAILLVIGARFFIKRRGWKRQEAATAFGTDGKAEMEHHEIPRNELPAGGGRHELSEQHGVVEMVARDARVIAHELPSEPLGIDGGGPAREVSG
ncbi:hypothetical protein L207DRAFT_563830 [Hyaloscypha variabilis F]|uniref:GPI-anchored cell wall organization protein Ecm33 n=1 Tax=Hyaloscypha variabilis (strain UAMH 11265 / GT02V1 / F) TaxID=1149755 RepID=A0A2J6RX21_HYAVF|nr:hypothetical protein L207DRAFT_563830 [Hyaloscypha variabilis F]